MEEIEFTLADADVIEEHDEDLLTHDQAAEAVRDHDHQIAINTAQELIRQRGILMEDLELALNAARRHRDILYAHALPDPYLTPVSDLLRKYKMEDWRCYGTRRPKPPKPERPELEKPQPKELVNPCTCGRSAEQRWHHKECPLREEY